MLVLEESKGGKLYELVKLAEGPLHDALRPKDLDPEQRRELWKMLREIRDWLKQTLPEVSAEDFDVDDVLVIDSGNDDGAPGTRSPAFLGHTDRSESTRRGMEVESDELRYPSPAQANTGDGTACAESAA